MENRSKPNKDSKKAILILSINNRNELVVYKEILSALRGGLHTVELVSSIN